MMERFTLERRKNFGKVYKIVPYLTPEEAILLASEAEKRRNGKRDSLFILVLFETGLRVSEALSLTPSKIDLFEGRPVLRIVGKGRKPRAVACPAALVNRLKTYSNRKNIKPEQRFFPINRQRAWQILKEVSKRAGFTKRVYPHLLRHSDAIERLRQTGNPKALQHHLGHSSVIMVMRYLSTLTEEDSLRVQQQVVFNHTKR
ncbi:MAG: site-specific integrase [Actinobacteria bacterium]|nr:site-specific integrase [Actinomycetota bacterium]